MAMGGTRSSVRFLSDPVSPMVAVSRDPCGIWLLSLAAASGEAKRDKFLKGPASGTWAIGKNKSHTSYGTSEHNWETGEYTIRTFRVHYDFPMEITERMRVKDDDQTLVGQRTRFRAAIQSEWRITVEISPIRSLS